MPFMEIDMPAKLFLKHNGVNIYHAYKDNDTNQGAEKYSFSTSRNYTDAEYIFDVRVLDVPASESLDDHPPLLKSTDSANERATLELMWASWNETGETECIKNIIRQAIDGGLIKDPDLEEDDEDPFDEAQAISEGWRLHVPEGRILIARVVPGGDLPITFPSDTDALIFVALKANEGSAYHRKALELIGSY